MVQLGEKVSGDYWVGAAKHPPLYKTMAHSNGPNVNTAKVEKLAQSLQSCPTEFSAMMQIFSQILEMWLVWLKDYLFYFK